ncbi:hypothetical protein [Providencia sp. PROV254]|uniref:hypothetical protein n=1 Tax=Providencia sp. PROV254 TaxID=2949942 RepID=UPI00234A5052|nr:hypothetical protein [Providencia sp. PROV254]HEP0304284.1 hypothetical protein [Providencia rettgeri]
MSMMSFTGLQIQSPLIAPDRDNFKPDTWPPPPDFPVVIDNCGRVISRYGDARWDLSPWIGRTQTIHFGDGAGKGRAISPENAQLLRKIVAWWLWGENATRSVRALVYRFETMKPLFVACSDSGIIATELYKYHRVIESVSDYYKKRGFRLIDNLHSLYLAKEKLGFFILDEKGISFLSGLFVHEESTQTAYIPSRIWSYQVSRLHECLSDFLDHREKVEACYNFCLSACARNAGGELSKAFGGLGIDTPFGRSRKEGKRRSGKIFYREFRYMAEEFGISNLLDRWVLLNRSAGIRALSTYLTLISNVGLAYVLNFSLMRVDEGARLRADCLEIERDPLGDDIYMVKGVTTKTIEDRDARWIVSPTVEMAIKAMTIVAMLRLKAAKENPNIQIVEEDIHNPLLQSLPHEPWSSNAPKFQSTKKYKKMRSYSEFTHLWPKLFDKKQLTITEADLEVANRLTSGLCPDKFALGKIWPLSWHQLRRTGAVNMLASGLVSESTLQYQLKHASRAMSLYYGKNYYRLKNPLDNKARIYYLREMYQSMIREFKALQSDQYISPHGEKRKQQILSEVSGKDHEQLLKAAKMGKINYRQTFLGGCTKQGPPCPLGGISNISRCMGFGANNACPSILLDKAKLPIIKELKNIIINQIRGICLSDSLLYESLQAQLESVQRAIHVIENS